MQDSLNEIPLNGIMIAALYGRSLVQPEPSDHLVPKQIPPGSDIVKYLGYNAKNITILVNEPGYPFLPENAMAFITKMLGACNLNTGDVAIVNMASGNPDPALIKQQLLPAKIISFGNTTGTSFFNVSNDNGIFILSVPTLKEIIDESPESRQLKTKLWAALIQLFNIELPLKGQ